MTNSDPNTKTLNRANVLEALQIDDKTVRGLTIKNVPAIKITGKAGTRHALYNYHSLPKNDSDPYVLIIPVNERKIYEMRQPQYGYTMEDITLTLKNLTDVEYNILDGHPEHLGVILQMASCTFTITHPRTKKIITLRKYNDVVFIEDKPVLDKEKSNKG